MFASVLASDMEDEPRVSRYSSREEIKSTQEVFFLPPRIDFKILILDEENVFQTTPELQWFYNF